MCVVAVHVYTYLYEIVFKRGDAAASTEDVCSTNHEFLADCTVVPYLDGFWIRVISQRSKYRWHVS